MCNLNWMVWTECVQINTVITDCKHYVWQNPTLNAASCQFTYMLAGLQNTCHKCHISILPCRLKRNLFDQQPYWSQFLLLTMPVLYIELPRQCAISGHTEVVATAIKNTWIELNIMVNGTYRPTPVCWWVLLNMSCSPAAYMPFKTQLASPDTDKDCLNLDQICNWSTKCFARGSIEL